MSRYYFHIRDGQDLIQDDIGSLFDSASDAHNEAIRLARSVGRDMGDVGESLDDLQVEMCDEAGVVVRIVEFAEVRAPR